jgi:hypothetical protein
VGFVLAGCNEFVTRLEARGNPAFLIVFISLAELYFQDYPRELMNGLMAKYSQHWLILFLDPSI